jgi:hypothetical protein
VASVSPAAGARQPVTQTKPRKPEKIENA